MSWQAYVDNLLASAVIDQAALFNKEGTSSWAASTNFQVSAPEIREVVNGFEDQKKVYSEGFSVAGKRYVVIKADERSLYGKRGKEGVVIVKTALAILIGHYSENVQPGAAVTTVEKLADYLISVGY